ncbi:MAG TPA: hypothetical protein VNL17_17030 [Verrucomicrobiae bacterium]|nr:hypothetical protein [Verrucomicrobiae bacterium]
MNFVRYHVVHAKIVILYMIVLWPLLMLSNYLGKQAGLHLAALAVKILIGVWLVASLWMSYQTSKRIVFKNMTLKKATVASFCDARPYLAFLPMVRRFFKARGKDGDTGDGQDI